MSKVQSPLRSQFATPQEAEAYDVWFRAKVQASIDDDLQPAPHDQAMAKLREIIEAKRSGHASDPPAKADETPIAFRILT